MRIISGAHKGRKLYSVRGTNTRPTSDRVREALFSILGSKTVGARVLDLYAGTGALGIEALSRGADYAVFIDHSPQVLAVLCKNIEQCHLAAHSRIIRWDIPKNLNCLIPDQTFDLVFLDPPYQKKMVPITLSHLLARRCLNTGTLLVVEHDSGTTIDVPEAALRIKDTRRYGRTALSVYSFAVP